MKVLDRCSLGPAPAERAAPLTRRRLARLTRRTKIRGAELNPPDMDIRIPLPKHERPGSIDEINTLFRPEAVRRRGHGPIMARNATPPYRVGVVGVKGPGSGGVGDAHARALKASLERGGGRGLRPSTPAGLEAYQAAHGPIATYTDVAADVGRPRRSTYSALPPATILTASLLRPVVEPGVPMIFCEKPLDVTLERGDRMVRAVEQAGSTFSCDHNPPLDADLGHREADPG